MGLVQYTPPVSATGTSFSVTFAQPTTAGNRILVALLNEFAATPPSLSVGDNDLSDYTTLADEGNAGDSVQFGLSLFRSTGAITGRAGHQVTLIATSTAQMTAVALEVAGYGFGVEGVSQSGTGTTATPGSLNTNPREHCFFIEAVVENQANTHMIPEGWTPLYISAGVGGRGGSIAYRIQPAIATLNPGTTWSVSAAWWAGQGFLGAFPNIGATGRIDKSVKVGSGMGRSDQYKWK
jgi:hypothetical protein